MLIYQLLGDRQPKTRPARLPGNHWEEDAVLQIRSNACSIVDNLHPED